MKQYIQIKNVKKISQVAIIWCFSVLIFMAVFEYSKAFILYNLSIPKTFGYETNNNNLNLSPFFKSKKLDAKVKEIIAGLELLNTDINHETNFIGEEFVNLFFTLGSDGSKTYVSYLLDTKEGQMHSVDVLLKDDSLHILGDEIEKALNSKYPKFITDALKGEGNIAYNIKNDKIIVYFSEYKINPNPKIDIFITLSNSILNDIWKYPLLVDPYYADDNIYSLDKSKKSVAFTFDDGPSADRTDKIVDILNNNKAHATFFMLGSRMRDYPGLVRTVLSSGNEIGSHSFSHHYLTSLKQKNLDYEINETKKVYKDITGEELVLLRPPYGKLNEKIRNSLNMPFIMWSVDPRDWEVRDTAKVISSVLEDIEDGDIVIMHDNYITTIEALRVILPELYIRGFQVVSVSELAMLKDKEINSHAVYRSFKY